jgi:hypothetical protein
MDQRAAAATGTCERDYATSIALERVQESDSDSGRLPAAVTTVLSGGTVPGRSDRVLSNECPSHRDIDPLQRAADPVLLPDAGEPGRSLPCCWRPASWPTAPAAWSAGRTFPRS